MRVAFSAFLLLPVSRTLEFSNRFVIAALVLIVAALPLSGCAVKLAPEYDKAIFDGLAKANEEAMTLFSSVASGVKKDNFSRRQASYDGVIGKLDAVRVQIGSRVAPESPALMAEILKRTAAVPASETSAQPALPAVPSLGSLDRLIQTMTSMRNVDSQHGLSPMLVMGYKLRFEISMEQALTYEKALNR